jgi:hypothetical protein
VNDGWELKIDPTNMEAIIKWSITNVTEARIFVGVVEYLQNFIEYFSVIIAPLHTIAVSGKSFQWGNC